MLILRRELIPRARRCGEEMTTNTRAVDNRFVQTKDGRRLPVVNSTSLSATSSGFCVLHLELGVGTCRVSPAVLAARVRTTE